MTACFKRPVRSTLARLRRAACLLLVTALTLHLAACSTLSPPAAAALLNDALFNHPARPADADSALALDDNMRAYLRSRLGGGALRQGKARALTDALYASNALRLQYDAAYTRNAAQAFAARSGNCLSLVLMTAAFARELGLTVSFQSARLDDAFSRQSELTLQSGHVNLVLEPRAAVGHWQTWRGNADPDRLQIDFLPASALRGLRSVPISESTVLAMFMNNRAAEALARHQPTEAYAWVREALHTDPGFWPAFNTLGVVYQQAGHLDAAALVYQQLLARDDRQVATLWNLAQVLQAQGRSDEAARWTERRKALEPVPPFHYLLLGEAAMARGAFAEARSLFQRELRITGDSHELQFWLAQAHFRLGEWGPAQQALLQAMSTSPGPADHARYAGKLAWLRAQGQL